MEIGGLMAEAFKAFIGNPDIMAVLLSFSVAITIILTVIEIHHKTKL